MKAATIGHDRTEAARSTMNADDRRLLERAVEVAALARARTDHPFGAVLADEHSEVLLEAGNTVVTEHDVTGHAELNLVRLAWRRFSEADLARCTLYSSTEPCAMCAGAIYWSGIGRVVYALSQDDLHRFTGADTENPAMHLPARAVLAAGQRRVEVEGPLELPSAAAVHEGFWDPGRTRAS
jgi:tRNA(Arg) A34 adenosine deaminase TadA